MTQPDIDRLTAALAAHPGQVYTVPFLYRIDRVDVKESFGMLRPVVVFANPRGYGDMQFLDDLALDDCRIITPIP